MEYLNQKVSIINDYLNKYIADSNDYQQLIFDSMKYSIFAGGKRLRPILMICSYETILNKQNLEDISKVIPFACAIEMIHTYSLIHDDLPAMDNDDYRRGKLTNHKVYGEGIAILAGDSLLNLAFETMINSSLDNPINGLKAMKVIANASGVYGMIGGQVVDLQSENKQIDKATLNYIHKNKTAALIEVSLEAGAILADASPNQIELLKNAGYKLGIAFQIQDDILDIIGSQHKLGKSTNSDLKNQKSTFVSLYGLEQSKLYVKKYSDEAIEIFNQFGDGGRILIDLTNYLVSRQS